MSDPRIWQLIQRWMDGQIIRVNQSQLADAIGVGRQSITQWKRGETRPSPENLRRLAEVTRIPYADLTDALLRDLGYVTDEREDVGPDVRAASTKQAPESGAASASDSSNVTQLPSAEALDPIIPADVAARDEGQPSKTQRARERQDKETEGP